MIESRAKRISVLLPTVFRGMFLVAALAAILFYFTVSHHARTDGTVSQTQKIGDALGGFTGTLIDGDRFGTGIEDIGDLDGDGVNDLAVGAWRDDDGGTDRGAVWILFMNRNGTVKSEQKISDTAGGFDGTLTNGDEFGFSIANLGDLDGDMVQDLAVGARADDDGGTNRGAVWILFMDTDGTVKSEQKISDAAGSFGGTLDDADLFGLAIAVIDDVNGDTIQDIAVGASGDDDGETNAGAVWILQLDTDGTVKAEQKIAEGSGGLSITFDDTDRFGSSVTVLNDIDGDGIDDWIVGAPLDDDGGTDRGAVYVLFMNANGTVKSEQKISALAGGLADVLDDDDRFGISAVGMGDLDVNGTDDVTIGAWRDDDGGTDRGAVYVLFLNNDGTVRVQQKISALEGSFTGSLDELDRFGLAVGTLSNAGDTLIVGASTDDQGGSDRGSFYLLSLDVLSGSHPFPTPNNIQIDPIGVNGCVTTREMMFRVHASDAEEIAFSNTHDFSISEWLPFDDSVQNNFSWVLPEADGVHTVYVRLRSRTHNLSNVIPVQVTLDQLNGCDSQTGIFIKLPEFFKTLLK